MLLRHDPAVVCSTTKAFFNDTLVKLIFSPAEVKLEAYAQRGVYDASCNFWKWQSFTFTAKGTWELLDTLVMNIGGDTLKIINDSQATVTAGASGIGHPPVMNKISIHRENRRIHIRPGPASGIRRVVLVDAAGRLLWERTVAALTINTIVSPQLTSGIHLVIIEFADGRSEIRRIVLPGR